jgi:O-antigen ligase
MLKKHQIINFILVSTVLAGFIPIYGKNIWQNNHLFFVISIMACLSLRLWKFNKVLSVFCLCGLCTLLDVNSSIRQFILNNNGFQTLLNLILALNFSAYIAETKNNDKKKVFIGVLFLVLFNFVIVIMQHFNICPLFEQTRSLAFDNTVGFCGSRNQSGVFFGLTMPLLLYFHPLLIVISMIGIGFSATSTVVVGAIVGFLFYSYYLSKRMLMFLFIVVIAGSLFFFNKVDKFSSGEMKNRVNLVKLTVSQVLNEKMTLKINENVSKVITCNKLTGYGLGNFTSLSVRSQEHEKPNESGDHVYMHCHNDYVELFFETGFVGVSIFLVWFMNLVYRFFKVRIKTKIMVMSFSSMIVAFVSSLGVYTVHTTVSGLLIILFYGILEGELKKWEDEEKAEHSLNGIRVD